MAPTGKVAFLSSQVKLFADGAMISQLMQMKGGYTDGHKGEWIATPQELRAATKLYWDAGYQIHIHVNGDLGLDVVLDAIERCMRENPRYDHRTVLVHFANSTEEQVARIARLGMHRQRQPVLRDGLRRPLCRGGPGARASQCDGASGLAGAHGAFRSRSIPTCPWARPGRSTSHGVPVNRMTGSGRVAGKEQRITVEQALRAVTLDAAYSWRMEQEMGSIAPGKVANFTVLEEDPLAVDPMKLKDIPIWGTVFEGTVHPVRK